MPESIILSAKRLDLLACNPFICQAILTGEATLSQMLHVTIADGWSHFGTESFAYAYDRIRETPADLNWWSYLIIHREDQALIGSGGYKGAPDQSGSVEIGYEIAESYQNRGLATEAARTLIENAFRFPAVKMVRAHTLAEKNASVRVLKKCGMRFVHTLHDTEDGDIWLWEVGLD